MIPRITIYYMCYLEILSVGNAIYRYSSNKYKNIRTEKMAPYKFGNTPIN